MRARIDYSEKVVIESEPVVEFRWFGRGKVRALKIVKWSERLNKLNWLVFAFLLGECMVRGIVTMMEGDSINRELNVVLHCVGDIVFTVLLMILVAVIALYLLGKWVAKEEERAFRAHMYRVVTNQSNGKIFIMNHDQPQDHSRLERVRRDRR